MTAGTLDGFEFFVDFMYPCIYSEKKGEEMGYARISSSTVNLHFHLYWWCYLEYIVFFRTHWLLDMSLCEPCRWFFLTEMKFRIQTVFEMNQKMIYVLAKFLLFYFKTFVTFECEIRYFVIQSWVTCEEWVDFLVKPMGCWVGFTFCKTLCTSQLRTPIPGE